MSEKFNSRQKQVAISEGGWAKSKNDRGGETVFGVARKAWPKWEGWAHVDAYAESLGRGTPSFIHAVNNDLVIKEMAVDLFYNEFWLKIRGDDLPSPLDGIMYDLAINSGPATANKLLTKVLVKMGCGEERSKALSDAQIQFVQDLHDTDMFDQLMDLWLLKRKQKYQSIAFNDSTQMSNLTPWCNRLRYVAETYIGRIPEFLEEGKDNDETF